MTGERHGAPAAAEDGPGRARRFQDLVEAHTPLLYRVALRLARSRMEAEDLVQETFVRAWRRFETFDPGSNARAWLTTILRHAHFERLRRDKHWRLATADVEDIDESYLYARVHDADEFRQAGDPAAAFFAALTSDQVSAALKALRPQFRAVFALADLEGFSYRDISKILRIPEGTVMSRLYRARHQLQRALWDYCVRTGQCRAPAAVPERPTVPWECREACRQIYQYLDKTLDAAALAAIDRHLQDCHRCCTRVEFQRRLADTVREILGAVEVPERFRAELRAVVERF